MERGLNGFAKAKTRIYTDFYLHFVHIVIKKGLRN